MNLFEYSTSPVYQYLASNHTSCLHNTTHLLPPALSTPFMDLYLLCYNLLLVCLISLCLACLTLLGHILELQEITQLLFALWLIVTLQMPTC